MSTLTVSATHDYRPDLLTGITTIDFAIRGVVPLDATFAASQFDGTHIKTNLIIDGSAGANHVFVTGAHDFAMYGFSFVNWSANDFVQVTGTSGNDAIMGSDYSDRLFGAAGNDTMTAYLGIDVLGRDTVDGGAGDDLISCRAGIAVGGAGNDTFNIDLGSGPHNVDAALKVDIADGGGGRDIGTGVTISGFEALSGIGSAHNDTLLGGSLSDGVQGGLGNDIIQGRAGDDFLYGEGGNDNLSGGVGFDFLIGGTGQDVMTGGANADRFMFTDLAEMGHGSTRDVIMDFQQGLDMIDLFQIDAGGAGHTNDPFVFVGRTAFAGILYGPEVRFFQTAHDTIIQIESPNSASIVEIRLAGLINLTANDFIF